MRAFALVLYSVLPLATLACSGLDLDETQQALGGDAGGGSGADADTNQPPIAVDDYVETDMGMPVGIYVLGNDSDPDGDPLTVTVLGGDWPFSRTTYDCWSDGNCWIEAYPHEHGTGTFAYQVCDPGGLCAEATVTVTIRHIPVNAYAEDDTATTDRDVPADIFVLANDTDQDAGWDYYSFWIVQGPFYGAPEWNYDGVLTYIPGPGYQGSDVFQYEICNRDARCARAWVTVFVDPSSPIIARPDDHTAYSGFEHDVLARDNDRWPGQQISNLTVVVPPEHGSVFSDGWSIYYRPHDEYTGFDLFGYELCEEGQCAVALVRLTIRSNDPPVIVPDYIITNEDTPVDFNALANDYDPDGDPLHLSSECYAVDWPFNRGELFCTIEGPCYFSPAPQESGIASIFCMVCDQLYCEEEIVTLQVDRVINPPEAYDDAAATTEDTPVEIDVFSNDAYNGSPPDFESMTFELTPGATAVVDTWSGRVTYTPPPNFAGTDVFFYTLGDRQGLFATAKVTVTITGVEDPPAFTAAATNTYQRIPKTGLPVRLQAVDPENGGPLVFARIAGSFPANLVLRADGTFATTGGLHKGTYASTIRVTDAASLSATTNLTIVVY